ncbi:hypothetical protein PHYBOEH_011819, partial [Phytophthora boehmeriae]
MDHPARRPRSDTSRWLLVLSVVVGLAGLSYVATVHNSLAAQQEIIANMQQQL